MSELYLLSTLINEPKPVQLIDIPATSTYGFTLTFQEHKELSI